MDWNISCLKPRIMKIEIDGVEFSGRTIKMLIQSYGAHIAKNLDSLPPDWEQRIFMALSERYPNYVKRKGSPPKQAKSFLSFFAMSTFINFMRKRLVDKTLVDKQTAVSRTSVCASCPLSSNKVGCQPCRAILESMVKVPEVIPGPIGCLACGCYLPLKVWIPDDQLVTLGEYPYPEHCWMPKKPQ